MSLNKQRKEIKMGTEIDKFTDLESSLLTQLKNAESEYATYKFIWENYLINVENCRKEYFSKKPRDPEYKKVFLKSLEEEKRARDKFDQSYTKIVTIRLKLSEVREVLDRKRNHQSILRRI